MELYWFYVNVVLFTYSEKDIVNWNRNRVRLFITLCIFEDDKEKLIEKLIE